MDWPDLLVTSIIFFWMFFMIFLHGLIFYKYQVRTQEEFLRIEDIRETETESESG